MVLGEINEVKEGSFKLYWGVAPVTVLAVNPTKAELGKIFGKEPEKEPVYYSQVEVEEGGVKKKKDRSRIEFIVRNEELNLTSRMSFFLEDSYLTTREGKYGVIDNFGNTAWVTPEEYKAKAIPLSKEGNPLRIANDYRLEKRGESELILFIRNLLGIKNSHTYNEKSKEWTLQADPSKYFCYFEKIEDILKGKVDEIRKIIAIAQGKKVKVLLGVRFNEGRIFQTVYERFTAKVSMNPVERKIKEKVKLSPDAPEETIERTIYVYDKFEEHIARRQSSGALDNFLFSFEDVSEYKPEPTKFANSSSTTSSTPSTPAASAPTINADDLPF
jgi:hypothetical protein